YPEEPHIPAAYLGIERVVLTPHVGSNTVQARTEMAQAVAHRILEVFAGRRPPNLINPEIYG
ncbi:MAG: D-glycerate dehydrogenase, partial [Clostridia bacterium]